jgi:hypothetical protein
MDFLRIFGVVNDETTPYRKGQNKDFPSDIWHFFFSSIEGLRKMTVVFKNQKRRNVESVVYVADRNMLAVQ